MDPVGHRFVPANRIFGAKPAKRQFRVFVSRDRLESTRQDREQKRDTGWCKRAPPINSGPEEIVKPDGCDSHGKINRNLVVTAKPGQTEEHAGHCRVRCRPLSSKRPDQKSTKNLRPEGHSKKSTKRKNETSEHGGRA